MTRRAVGPVAVAAAVVLRAGCDSGSSGPTDPTSVASSSAAPTSPPPSATASPTPTDGKQLIVDAQTVLHTGTTSFHVAGTIAEFHLAVDIRVGSGRVSSGTVSFVGGGNSRDTLVYAVGLVPCGGDYEISGPRDVAGTRAYVVTGLRDTWTLAADGPPLPIEVTNHEGAGTTRFDRYDEPFTVEAPPASEIVPIPAA